MGFNLSTIWAWTLNFVYPPYCALCSHLLETAASEVVCKTCEKTLHPLNPPYCERCSAPLDDVDADCDDCAGRTFHFTQTRTATIFNDPIQHLVHQLKYNRRRDIGLYLGRNLGYTMMGTTWFRDIDVLVPVPLHAVRKRERGFNQSEWVAQGVSEATSLPVDTELIKRTRATQTQTKLTLEERLINVSEAFQVMIPHAVKNKNIALVDDVLTTGATMNSCASVLLKNGASKVYAIAIARA